MNCLVRWCCVALCTLVNATPSIAAPTHVSVPSVPAGAAAPERQQVLVLYSYSTLRAYMLRQQEGILRSLNPEAVHGQWNYDVYEESLAFDAPTPFDDEAFCERLRSRYGSVGLDVIIVADTPALEFMDRHWESCLPVVPLVFSAARTVPTRFQTADLPVTGVVEASPIQGTVDLLRQLHPEVRTILFVVDRARDSTMVDAIMATAAHRRDLTVEFPVDLGSAACMDRLLNAPDDSAILFWSWPANDDRWSWRDILHFIKGSRRPTYCVYESHVGSGVVGGVVADGAVYGGEAGAMARRILEGESVRSIPINFRGANRPVFDGRELASWGIDRARLPEQSVVRFAAVPGPLITAREALVAAAGSLLAAIFTGLWLRARRAARALSASEERARALGNNLPGLTYQTLRLPDGTRRAEFLGPGLEALVGDAVGAEVRADLNRFFDLIHPDDAPRIRDERRAALAERRQLNCEYRLRCAGGEWRWVRSTARPTVLNDGAVRWHGVLLDTHAAKENEHALARRESILHAVADAGRLLSQTHDPLTTMNQVVRLLGSAAGADRAYLFDRVNDPTLGWVNRMIAEWTNGSVPAQIDDPNFAILPDSAWDRERWLEPLARGERITRATIDCSEPERSYFEAQGLKSVAIVPVILPGRWWGFLGFDACEQATPWKEVETDALSTAANAIAAALERREREAKLHEKDESLRRVAENIPGFIYRTTIDRDEMFRLEYVSPGFEDIFGQPPTWTTRHLTDLGDRYATEDRERAFCGMRRSVQTLEPFDFVTQVNRPDGGRRWVHIRATPSRRGTDTVFDGVVIDVTQRMSAEEALRSSEERYRYVFQANNDVIWDWDIASDRISWSESLRNAFGDSGGSLVTPTSACFDRIHPDDRERVRAGLASVVDGNGESWRDEYRFKRVDGSYAWVVNRAHVVRDASNRARRIIGALTDITALRETEQRLRVALQAGQMATWDWDIDSGIVSHSIEFGPMFGLEPTPGPTREQDIQGRMLPEDRELKPRAAQLAFEGDQPTFSTVCRVPLPDGAMSWIACEGRAVRNDPTGSRRVVGVSFDITHLKLTELALRESEERYRAVFQALPIGVCVHDGGRLLFANDSLRLLLRAPTVQAVLDLSLNQIIHPDHQADCEARAHGVLIDNTTSGPCEVRFVAVDGTPVEVEVRCTPLQYSGRRVVQTTILDLTERKKAESALRESEEKFRQITENAAEVFWLMEINPRILRYISPAFESIWGITVEEVMNTRGRFFETIHPDDRARVEKTAAGNTTGFDHEYRIVRPDGQIRWIRDRAYPVRDPSGRAVRIAGVADDITDAKAAEEALRHTTQTQQLLLSELDHRVKNSLTSLVTLIDLTSAATDGVREFADSIRARVLAMSSVHSLLSEGHWSPVPLERLVRALCPPETVGTIEVEGPPVEIPARQVTAFAMIVQELFTNSLKYGAAGHASGLVSVRWDLEEESATQTSFPRLYFQWHESNVPAITLPVTPGVGTRLIQGFCKFELNGQAHFDYLATEVRHSFTFTLDNDPPPLPDPTLIRAAAAPASDFSHVMLRNPT